MRRARVLFLTSHPVEAATIRYRVLQYVPHLEAAGIGCTVSPFMSSAFFRRLYEPGGIAYKSAYLAGAGLRRLGDVLRSARYDAVFVPREAVLFGPPVVEWLVTQVQRRPLLFDFDDATFLPQPNSTFGRLGNIIKCPGKTGNIVDMSAHVLAGNNYLAEFARSRNRPVTILPTVVDTDAYAATPRVPERNPVPVVGWIGTHSTAPFLERIYPALQELARRRQFVFRVIGAGHPITIPGVEVDNRPWSLKTELQDFRSLDVGVYPIPHDQWTLGKCAFKAIQYMAAEVPCICSPVGMTTEFVRHDENGFLAESTEEWLAGLESLLTDAALHRRIAAAGFETVSRDYSLRTHAPRLLRVLEDVLRL